MVQFNVTGLVNHAKKKLTIDYSRRQLGRKLIKSTDCANCENDAVALLGRRARRVYRMANPLDLGWFETRASGFNILFAHCNDLHVDIDRIRETQQAIIGKILERL